MSYGVEDRALKIEGLTFDQVSWLQKHLKNLKPERPIDKVYAQDILKRVHEPWLRHERARTNHTYAKIFAEQNALEDEMRAEYQERYNKIGMSEANS